jgi:hypothetical protein
MRFTREVLALVRVGLAGEARSRMSSTSSNTSMRSSRDTVGLEVRNLVGDPEPEHEAAAVIQFEHDRVLGEAHGWWRA